MSKRKTPTKPFCGITGVPSCLYVSKVIGFRARLDACAVPQAQASPVSASGFARKKVCRWAKAAASHRPIPPPPAQRTQSEKATGNTKTKTHRFQLHIRTATFSLCRLVGDADCFGDSLPAGLVLIFSTAYQTTTHFASESHPKCIKNHKPTKNKPKGCSQKGQYCEAHWKLFHRIA